jgi:hypothetical protein
MVNTMSGRDRRAALYLLMLLIAGCSIGVLSALTEADSQARGKTPRPDELRQESKATKVLRDLYRNLAMHATLSWFAVLWPIVTAGLLVCLEKMDLGDGLYVALATYLGGVPVPAQLVPTTRFGKGLVVVNRLFGLAVLAYLIAAFMIALQP